MKPLNYKTTTILLGITSSLAYHTLSAAVWTGAIDNNWSTAGNWDTDSVPGVNEDITIDTEAITEIILGTGMTGYPSRTGTGNNTFGGNAQISSPVAATHWNFTGAGSTLLKDNVELNLRKGGNETNNGGNGDTRFQNSGLLTIQDNASLSVDGFYFIAGFATRAGHIVQNGGSVTANLNRGFMISDRTGSGGSSYTLNSGTLDVTNSHNSATDYFGVLVGANGGDRFTVDGGTATFRSTDTRRGVDVSIKGGSSIQVLSGSATFHDYNQFLVGSSSWDGNPVNSLDVSGGELNITGRTNLILGHSAAGSFNLSGGAVTLEGLLQLGSSSNEGNVFMSGGSLFVEEIQATNGIFLYTGGTLVIRGNQEGIIDELWFDTSGASEAVTTWYDADNNWTVIGGAIPEPSALLLIGLVAPLLGLRRRTQA